MISLLPLEGNLKPYAWGDKRAIADFLGRAPSGGPEAELWLGAHPGGPAHVRAAGASLEALVAADPAGMLGPAASALDGGRLPFLLKLLAAAEPLSLQAHPSKEQAERGFDDEERRGVPRDAPTRNYKDRNHKPELIVALTPFEALSGFRPQAEAEAIFASLAVPLLRPLRDALAGEGGRRRAFAYLLAVASADAPALVASVRDAAAKLAAAGHEHAAALAWVDKLAALYPSDAGCITSLLLRHLVLAPGEGLYLAAGNMHAYLAGFGLELMASSDNVLRGGLTPKHVDPTELGRVVDVDAPPVRKVTAERVSDVEVRWPTPAREFALSRIEAPRDGSASFAVVGPEILVAAEGAPVVSHAAGASAPLTLRRGDAVFVPFSVGTYRVGGGGSVYRASIAAP